MLAAALVYAHQIYFASQLIYLHCSKHHDIVLKIEIAGMLFFKRKPKLRIFFLFLNVSNKKQLFQLLLRGQVI